MTELTHELRFCLAGVEVLLTSRCDMPALQGSYEAYPTRDGPPDLVLDFTVEPDMVEGRTPGPGYPAFRRSVRGGAVVLERFDVEGTLDVPNAPDTPISGRFRTCGDSHSIDAAVRAGLSIALPRRGGLILHASAVVHRGNAFAFLGKSGAGKSTIATLVTTALPDAVRLADDLLVVTPADDGWRSHVVPFIGAEGLPHRADYPLHAVHFLVQGRANRRTRLSTSDGLRELLRHVLAHVAEGRTADFVLAAGAELVRAVPLYSLEFRKEIEVVHVLGVT